VEVKPFPKSQDQVTAPEEVFTNDTGKGAHPVGLVTLNWATGNGSTVINAGEVEVPLHPDEVVTLSEMV
jgi:hypothetical protein